MQLALCYVCWIRIGMLGAAGCSALLNPSRQIIALEWGHSSAPSCRIVPGARVLLFACSRGSVDPFTYPV